MNALVNVFGRLISDETLNGASERLMFKFPILENWA